MYAYLCFFLVLYVYIYIYIYGLLPEIKHLFYINVLVTVVVACLMQNNISSPV